MFEDWLEQEQASLASLSHPEGNVDTLEKTLQQLQVLILWSVVRECTNVSSWLLNHFKQLHTVSLFFPCHFP